MRTRTSGRDRAGVARRCLTPQMNHRRYSPVHCPRPKRTRWRQTASCKPRSWSARERLTHQSLVGRESLFLVPAEIMNPAAGPSDQAKPGKQSLVTLFTRTGSTSSPPINPIDVQDPGDYDGDSDLNEPDGILDDPFEFAERGEEAGS